MTASHDVLHFTREVEQTIDQVWDAYADVNLRSQWSVPAGEVITYDKADFSAGGLDQYRCGARGQLHNHGCHHYHLIEPLRLLAYTDTVRRDGQLMAIALLT